MLRLHPSVGILALLWLQAASLVLAATGDGGCNVMFCTNITLTDKVITFEIKPIMEPFGWVAIGFGRRMKGTPMVILWDDNDGTPILSQRFGTGHVEPVLDPNPPRIATMVAPRETTKWVYNADTDFPTRAFQIPINKTDPHPGTMIWAYSIQRPTDGPLSNLTGHLVAGTINMRLDKHVVEDIPSQIVTTADSTGGFLRYSKAAWHGIVVSIGFLVLLPGGSLVARLGRTFTPKWFQLHRMINFYIALPVIAVGWSLGAWTVYDRGMGHLTDAHHLCGVLLFGLYITQIVLGRFIHAQHGTAGRAPHPPTNILHVLLGISVVALAFFQVRSGLAEYASHMGQPDAAWCHTLWSIWGLVLPVLYFGGLALLKRQFVQEKANKGVYDGTPTKNYIALATTPAFDNSDHELGVSGMGRGYSEVESGVPLLARGA
ncbi:Cytochrome b561 domain-containing protein [Mycena kentingensis (nom. inval.)]|nr:Cytochrome b561 domain-containing protein [Mycena kentingensis (nom. inval.)]